MNNKKGNRKKKKNIKSNKDEEKESQKLERIINKEINANDTKNNNDNDGDDKNSNSIGDNNDGNEINKNKKNSNTSSSGDSGDGGSGSGGDSDGSDGSSGNSSGSGSNSKKQKKKYTLRNKLNNKEDKISITEEMLKYKIKQKELMDIKNKKQDKCVICGKIYFLNDASICRICGFDRYCSKQCRRKDFKFHRNYCAKIRKDQQLKLIVSIHGLIVKTSELFTQPFSLDEDSRKKEEDFNKLNDNNSLSKNFGWEFVRVSDTKLKNEEIFHSKEEEQKYFYSDTEENEEEEEENIDKRKKEQQQQQKEEEETEEEPLIPQKYFFMVRNRKIRMKHTLENFIRKEIAPIPMFWALFSFGKIYMISLAFVMVLKHMEAENQTLFYFEGHKFDNEGNPSPDIQKFFVQSYRLLRVKLKNNPQNCASIPVVLTEKKWIYPSYENTQILIEFDVLDNERKMHRLWLDFGVSNYNPYENKHRMKVFFPIKLASPLDYDQDLEIDRSKIDQVNIEKEISKLKTDLHSEISEEKLFAFAVFSFKMSLLRDIYNSLS